MIPMMRTAACGGLALVVALASVVPAFAQPAAVGRAAPPRPSPGRDVCGASIVGQAPDIMTYDSGTGTQVFVGRPEAETSMTAYNTRTGSVAAVEGDLTRPGVATLCSVDVPGRESYSVSPNARGGVTVAGRNGPDRWSVVRDANGQVIWSPGRENDCFKLGLGLMGRDGLVGPAIAAGGGVAGVGLSTGRGFAGLGLAANDRMAGAGVVSC